VTVASALPGGRGPVVADEPPARLAGTRLWRSRYLSPEDRRALEGAVAWSRAYGANTDLVRAREQVDHLLFITRGWGYQYLCTRDGGRQLPALLVPGDMMNLDALLFGELDYGVKTLTPATIVAVPCSQALVLAETHPGIARAFTSLALIENAALSKTALSIGRRPACARLAHLFCELMVRLGYEDDGAYSFEFPLTQEQIGDALGLTPVHVNRMMQQLRGENLIRVSHRIMTIRDVAALRQACEFDPAYLHMDQQVPRTYQDAHLGA